jgi:hypothetical protein
MSWDRQRVRAACGFEGARPIAQRCGYAILVGQGHPLVEVEGSIGPDTAGAPQRPPLARTAARRGAAGSVEKNHQKAWLEDPWREDPGQALWHAERAKLLKADDPDSEGDEQDPGKIPAQKRIKETKRRRRL